MNGHVIEVDLLARRDDPAASATNGRILLSALPATWRVAVTLRFDGPRQPGDKAAGRAFAQALGRLLLRLDGLAVDVVAPEAGDPVGAGAPEPTRTRADVRVDLRDPDRAVDSLCDALAALTHLRPPEPNVVLEITEIDG